MRASSTASMLGPTAAALTRHVPSIMQHAIPAAAQTIVMQQLGPLQEELSISHLTNPAFADSGVIRNPPKSRARLMSTSKMVPTMPRASSSFRRKKKE